MELDDNCMETDNRKEIKSTTEVLKSPESSEQIRSPVEVSNKSELSEQIPSPAEASNKPESSEQISSPAEESNKPESSEQIPYPAEAFNKPGSSQQIPSPEEASNKPESPDLKIFSSAEALSGPESPEKKMSSPAEASNKTDSSEKKTASPAEASNSRKKTPRSLKGKAKILKKSPIHTSLKTSKATGSSQVNGRKRRRTRGNKESSNKREEYAKKLNTKKENQQNITNEEHTEKTHQAQKNPGKIDKLEKSHQKQRNTEKLHGSDKSVKSEKNDEKHDEKREKLGGLIFMCSGKTKPDCFHYCVMGVSMSKKDLVLDIKRGLKLFLYDFDLKLLYGIYKASSSGGLKLEPKAFGGAFPAQVRFTVEKECLPLPESVFKTAIKENYNEKKKFKTELTVRQVKKLTALFRPAQVHSTALGTRSPVEAKVRDWGIHEGVREPLPHSHRAHRAHRDAHARDSYENGDTRSYPVLAHQRDQHVAYQDEVSARREEVPCNLYLTEKEYRAYGLQGDRRNLTARVITPALEARPREYEREHLPRQPNLIYREAVPAHRENVHIDLLYLNDKDYQAYTLGARHELPPATSATAVDVYARDPYGSYYYGASSSDPYLAVPHRREDVLSGSYSVGGRRENYLIDTDPVQRRETDRVERLYSMHAVGGRRENYLIERDPMQRREPEHVERLSLYSARAAAAAEAPLHEALSAPVSSRYAFAGPSYSYR